MKNLNKKQLLSAIQETHKAKLTLLKNINKIKKIIYIFKDCIESGGKIFFCGNGGSAADAQHLTAELLIRLRPSITRKPYPAICLSLDSSTMTACGNDYSFSEIFSRPFEALANKNDILVAISTSGNSKNIIKVLKTAKKKKIKSISFLGGSGGKAKKLSYIPIVVENKKVSRIQESHIFLGHYILENLENLLIE